MKGETYIHPGGGECTNKVILAPGEGIIITGTVPRDNGCRTLEYWPSRGHEVTALIVYCPHTDTELVAQDAMDKVIEEEKRRTAIPPPRPAPIARKKRGRK